MFTAVSNSGVDVLALRDQGYRLARAGRAFESRRVLLGVVGRDPTDVMSWEVLGLCSFAAGKVVECGRFWREASDLTPGSQAQAWLRELESGGIGNALEEYRFALATAESGDYETAASVIASVRKTLPDFTPAGRLQGIIFAAQGNSEAAFRAWKTQLERNPDDPDLHRLLGEATQSADFRNQITLRGSARWNRTFMMPRLALAVTVAVLMAYFGVRRATERITNVQRGTANARSTNGSSSNASVPSSRSMAVGVPEHSASLTPTDRTLGWRLFVNGRTDLRRGSIPQAVQKLSEAVSKGPGSFYYDDALYALALSQERAGDKHAAASTAARLLSEAPNSIFANSVTRKLAQLTPDSKP